MPRERIPMAFGAGLDRGTGRMVVRPGSMTDLRNVLLLPGRVVFARGMRLVESFVDQYGDPVSHILGGIPVPGEGLMVVVVYQQDTGEIDVWVTNPDGTDPVSPSWQPGAVAGIGSVTAGSAPPIYSLPESANLVFLAHRQQ